ncbi:MAG: sigma-70 family RNA polymerase sigma factor [Gilvibacter sp.]
MNKSLFKNVCDKVVFERLYAKHSKNLHNFLYYKYGEAINPEDKVQEAFVKLWEKCKDVSIEKAKSFLFTVANNKTLNALKHKKVVLKYNQKPVKSHTNETPEFLLEESEFMQRFKNALESLPEGQRIAFMMNRVEGKKHQEIADILGISRKAVEKRIYTALGKLREQIKEL